MNYQKITLGIGLLLGIHTAGHAALLSRANGTMVYDTDRNITWVADGHLFKTLASSYTGGPVAYVQNIINVNNGVIHDTSNPIDGNDGIYNLNTNNFDTSTGQMNWFGAQAWANTLVFGGFDDWRLPTTNPTINGYNISGSEFGHLYYTELGKLPYTVGSNNWGIFDNNFSGLGVTGSVGLFNNVVAGVYWSATEVLSYPYQAWTFSIGLGYQGYSGTNKNSQFYGWVVRDGDVATVPVPPSVLLMSSVLIGLACFNRKRFNA